MIGKYRTKKLKPWGIPPYSWRLPIQNHLKASTTEKGQNKAKYLSRNYIRRKFVKKTSMPNPIERLGYIKCYSSSILSKMKLQLQLFWSKTVRKWGDKPDVWVEEGQASPSLHPPTPTWETLDLLKVLAIQSDATFRRSAVDQEDLKPY